MNILFVCTGNTCRSAIAEAYCNARAKEYDLPLQAESAGIAALNGQTASEDAIEAMEELYQMDLSEHRSRQVTGTLVEQADLVLAMTGMQREIIQESYPEFSDRIHTLAGYVRQLSSEPEEPSQEIPDPYGRGKTVYLETAQNIAVQIDRLIACISRIS